MNYEKKLEDLFAAAYAMAQGYLNAVESAPDKHPCGRCKEHAQELIAELKKWKAA